MNRNNVKTKLQVFTALAVFFLFALLPLNADTDLTKTKHENLRGVWVASVLNINYPTRSTSNATLLKVEADNIIESAKNAGFNAIFLQVRPSADSLYPSKIFPWSKYLTGTEGQAPSNGFDPLAYFIQEAHKRDMQVHAWINPYRITKKAANEPAYSVAMLSEKHPARLHPEYVIAHNGDLYFDPALPEVRNLIDAGVKEIIDAYDVDGIHFDDYFYPGTDFNDATSYAKFGNGKNLADWRRDNVNKLVAQIHQTVHASKKELVFGISPFGIWANEESLAGGSKTKGNQSYHAHYADSLYWINNEIIDYIAPQIYWNMGFEIADFKVLTDWWAEAVKDSKVKLYIGLAAYRGDNANVESPWYQNHELKRQLAYLQEKKEVDGFIAFSIGSVRASNRIYNAFRGAGKIKAVEDYTVPSVNLIGGAKYQFVGGLVFPNTLGFLNGQQLYRVSDKGFYGILVQSNPQKTFTVENNGKVAGKTYPSMNGWFKTSPANDQKAVKNYNYLNETLKEEILFARIKEDDTDLRADVDPKNGAMELLPKGVIDEIESVHGAVAKLSSNRYVFMKDVDVISKKDTVYKLDSAVYTPGDKFDKIEFKGNVSPFVKAYLNQGALILDISGNVQIPEIQVPETASVTSAIKAKNGFRNTYTLKLKDKNRLGGYYVEYGEGTVTVTLKHKKTMKDGEKPLEGFDIVLDAGHGGSDTGALGLLGTAYPEKYVALDITLKLSEKLKKLGANVILTRDKETTLSLFDRLKTVYTHKPDLFISVHANSTGLTTDNNNIKGFSVYYSKDIARDFSLLTQNVLCSNTACIDNKAREADFYVIRGTHCPSVLLETGFMPNPEDFDWLCDDQKQDEFVSELTRSILLYFAK